MTGPDKAKGRAPERANSRWRIGLRHILFYCLFGLFGAGPLIYYATGLPFSLCIAALTLAFACFYGASRLSGNPLIALPLSYVAFIALSTATVVLVFDSALSVDKWMDWVLPASTDVFLAALFAMVTSLVVTELVMRWLGGKVSKTR